MVIEVKIEGYSHKKSILRYEVKMSYDDMGSGLIRPIYETTSVQWILVLKWNVLLPSCRLQSENGINGIINQTSNKNGVVLTQSIKKVSYIKHWLQTRARII